MYAAQEAGIAAAKPGAKFSDIHAAAIRVIAEHLHAWGLLPDGVCVEDTLDTEHGQYHRRWMVHGTLAPPRHRRPRLRPRHPQRVHGRRAQGRAWCSPSSPGLYFKADDLKVPERFRGIGVRIEDDVVITADGCENLSAAHAAHQRRRRGVDRRRPRGERLSRRPRRRASAPVDDVQREGVGDAVGLRRLGPHLEDHRHELVRLGELVGQRGVVGRVRLERRDRPLDLVGHVDVVRRPRACPAKASTLDVPRLEPLVDQLGEDPPVAGVGDGVDAWRARRPGGRPG